MGSPTNICRPLWRGHKAENEGRFDLSSPEAIEINRYDLKASVEQVAAVFLQYLSQSDIDRIYGMLYPLTQISDAKKQQHIQSIRERMRKQ